MCVFWLVLLVSFCTRPAFLLFLLFVCQTPACFCSIIFAAQSSILLLFWFDSWAVSLFVAFGLWAVCCSGGMIGRRRPQHHLELSPICLGSSGCGENGSGGTREPYLFMMYALWLPSP